MATSNCPQCDECTTEFCQDEVPCNVISCGCCCELPVRIVPNRTIKAGTIMAQRASDEFWDAYDPNATDGLQIPRGVLKFSVETDANGRFTRTFSPFGLNCGDLYANIWICGTFRIEATPGGTLAQALSHESFGRLLKGNVGGAGIWKMV